MNRKQKGALGEEKAAQLLKESGHRILARNYRSKQGEIDIIAFKSDVLLFIEVKVLDCFKVESLEYIINARKMQRIRMTSKYFIVKNPQFLKMISGLWSIIKMPFKEGIEF